jgi:predicted nucleic acid-binding protein
VRAVLFDADAFLCIRKLSFLRSVGEGQQPWLMTGYVARHELSTVAAAIDALCLSGRLLIHELPARDPRFRALKQKGHDKGEAEAIAWAMHLPREDRPLFVSIDKRAREGARENGVPSGDIMDWIVEVVGCGAIAIEAAREKASIWDDKRQVQGRPHDYTTFDDTFERRRQAKDTG